MMFLFMILCLNKFSFLEIESLVSIHNTYVYEYVFTTYVVYLFATLWYLLMLVRTYV